MEEKYLPIGSVVLLEKATKRIMITGYAVKSLEDDNVYDYVGCLWPEGVVSSDRNLLFNHDNIEKIISKGYSDDETTKFMDVLNKALEEVKKEETANLEEDK